MNISKIFRSVVGIGAVSGIAYLAYKVGEANGEINERYREDDVENTEDNAENEFTYDEPDDGCIAPAREYTMADLEDISSFERESTNSSEFLPIESITSIPVDKAKSLLLFGITKGFITNKLVRDIFNVDFDKAAEIISEFQKNGYIGEKAGNYRYPVKVRFRDFMDLLKTER